MQTKFNVFEILQIAEQIEHKGAKFYLRTAELFDDGECRSILYKLANWKAKHEKAFAQRRKHFSEKTGQFGTFDPDNYVLSNPAVMAGLAAFASKPGSERGLTGREDKGQMLKSVILRSKQVLAFYQGLKDFARDPASKDIVEQVIKEEEAYIRTVSKELEQT